MSKVPITVTVNSTTHSRQVEPRMLLVDLLREEIGLTGPHIGCIEGKCGACTVLLDGSSVKSCLIFAAQVDGAEITTIEGLAINGRLHPLQEAFWESFAVQCGYCTAGMILASYQLLKRNPQPTEEQIRQALVGNLCRCTGYVNIVNAVKVAAQKLGRECVEAGHHNAVS